jgi:hypothetical protein
MARPKLEKTKRREALAAQYGCDPQTIQAWELAGAPLDDPDSMQSFLEDRQNANDELEPEDLKAAKLAKIKAETKRILFKLKVEQGSYTDNAEVDRMATAWAAQLRTELMSLLAVAPTWCGLDSAQLEDRARSYIDATLERLRSFNA